MARRAHRVNGEWETPVNWTWEHCQLEVLMDIREELRRMNALLHCVNFVGIPKTLKEIERNTTKKPRKAKGAK